MQQVVFSHGKESGPLGTKIKKLMVVAQSLGYATASLDYTGCENAEARVHLLKTFLDENNIENPVLVGSSMGGYVSTVCATTRPVAGLFLLCPALYMSASEYTVQDYTPKCTHIELVHGWEDDIVPYQHSVKFAAQTHAVLNLLSDNHRLSNSHDFLAKRLDLFLKQLD